MFKLKLDQKGMSLPIVLFVSALIMANSYYFLAMNKNSQRDNAIQSTELKEESEKRRLVGLLSDYENCDANFKNKTLASLLVQTPPAVTTLANKTGTVFLNTATPVYMGGKYKFLKMYFLKTAASPTPENISYTLTLQYEPFSNPSGGAVGTSSSGKKISIVQVPLYLEITGGSISRCYTRPDDDTSTSKAEAAITNACLGNAANLFTDPATQIMTCTHAVAPLNCAVTGNGFGFINSTVISATSTTANTGKAVSYTCAFIPASACAANPYPLTATGIVNSAITCGDPLPNCPAGSAYIKNGLTFTCTTNCASDFLFNSINIASGVPTCYPRIKNCPAGQYVKQVNPDGTIQCEALSFLGKDCGNLNYATNFDPESTTNQLGCTPYTRTRDCGANRFSGINSLATVTPACNQNTY